MPRDVRYALAFAPALSSARRLLNQSRAKALISYSGRFGSSSSRLLATSRISTPERAATCFTASTKSIPCRSITNEKTSPDFPQPKHL